MAEDDKINPRDIASSTAIGAASRLGVARAKQQGPSNKLLADEVAAGAAIGVAKPKKKASAGGTSVLGLVAFGAFLVVMLGLMMVMSGR